MATANRYHEQARLFLGQAFRELGDDDLRQASEKAWGAAAQTVKGLADARGWPHASHALLWKAVYRLQEETRDRSIVHLFSVANALHINFYDGMLEADAIRSMLDDVAAFVNTASDL